ncbi:MAG TPA: GTPase HflX, partial [Myxococcales bacterium]|nr:GTPase HflX [Myxococcales bacterium]
EVFVEDKLFATLDPVSRRLRFPRDREVIITDTVGFIRDLPADLMTAFRATLEEMRDASLLVHVVDATAPDLERRMSAVRTVLDNIELAEKPELLVFNQIDLLPEGEANALTQRHGGVAVSALRGEGLIELLRAAECVLWGDQAKAEVGHSLTDDWTVDGR